MRGQITAVPIRGLDAELTDHFRAVVEHTGALLHATADLGGEKLTALRARVDQSLRAVQGKMAEAQERVVDRAKGEIEAADAYVHENPWKVISVAAGAAFLVGLVVSRR